MAVTPLRIPPNAPGTTRKILLADDDPGMRAIVSMNLIADGFDVTAVEDGQAALDEAARIHPDLIVLDVMMPVLDGYDVLRVLKANPEMQSIPVVLLTAKAMDDEVWDGWKSGADYYMTKPFVPDELARFVRHVLGPGGEL